MSEPRFDTFIWTEFELGEASGQGSIQNVGPGGLFVRSSTTGRTGDPIRLSFAAPDGENVEAIGVVWWTRHDLGGRGPGEHGFGVRLVASSGAYRRLLRSLERPGKSAPRRSPAS